VSPATAEAVCYDGAMLSGVGVMGLAMALLASWGALTPPPPVSSAAEAKIFDAEEAAALVGTEPTAVGPGKVSPNKEIIRQIIRHHIVDVRACYEAALMNEPSLFGRISVTFSIASDGVVISAVLESSTMALPAVETCIVGAVRRWQFPKPIGGGKVIVTYPFILRPSDAVVLTPGANGAFRNEIHFGPDGVTAIHTTTEEHGVPANGLVVATAKGLILVDTGWTERQTEAILHWGAERLRRPWLGAVVTHDHQDRSGGLGALIKRHIPVAALDLTVTRLRERGVGGVEVLFKAMDRAFTDLRGFEAFYPGPGHSPDNIVIQAGSTLFGGCLLKASEAKDLGNVRDANLELWPTAVRLVVNRYRDRSAARTIVPGHGELDETGTTFQHTLELLAKDQPGRASRQTK
jgi:metallo-beta-lactamase class B